MNTCKVSKQLGCQCLSCHHNADTNIWSNKWDGTETFSLSASATKATKLANIVHKRLVKATGLQNRGGKHANYQVLRDTSMPAILTEGGFMDSTIDIKYMRNSAWLASQGYAIADGIAEYLGLKVIPSHWLVTRIQRSITNQMRLKDCIVLLKNVANTMALNSMSLNVFKRLK